MFKCLLFNVASGANMVGNGRSVGVYRIAHFLREHDWDAEVIDFATEWTFDELKNLARSRIDANTRFIGFSHMYSIWSDTLELFASWLKINYPTIPLISGSGIAPQFKSENLDFYVQGFGELAILELLKYLFSNGTRPRFSLSKTNGKLLLSANDQYPSFPMKNLKVIYQDRDYIQSSEWLGIENLHQLGQTIKNISYTLETLDQMEYCLEEVQRFGTKYCPAFRVRTGVDIGRYPGGPTVYMSDLVKEMKRIADKNNWSVKKIHTEGNRAHYAVTVNDIPIKIIQWPDVRTIDLKEIQTEAIGDFVPNKPRSPLIHQIILRDAAVNKGLPLYDTIPKEYVEKYGLQ